MDWRVGLTWILAGVLVCSLGFLLWACLVVGARADEEARERDN